MYQLAGGGTTASDFSVDGQRGLVRQSGPSANHSALAAVSATDAAMVVSVSADRLPVGGSMWFYDVGRQNGGTEYRARLQVATSGNLSLGLSSVTSNVEVPITGDIALTRLGHYLPGTLLRIRLQAEGTSPTRLSVRVWPADQPEPDQWDARAEDSTVGLQGPGRWGVRAYIAKAATQFPALAFDDLRLVLANELVSATTWHVSAGGSDTGMGTVVSPFRTIQRAVDLSLPGDTVMIGPGTFDGFEVGVAARADAPLTILGAEPGLTTVTASATRTNAIRITSATRYLTIEDLTVTGATAYRSAGVLVDSVLNGPVELRNLDLVDNAGFGLSIFGSRNVVLESSEASGNGTAVLVTSEGAGVVIRGNDLHDNDLMIRNTPGGNDDYGANGVSVVKTVGPTVVEGNRIWGNRATSYDYGSDGGALELYGASGLTMRGNTIWDNEDVLETGTDSGVPCSGNSFVRNAVTGGASVGRSQGIILRCGDGMLIAHNTITALDSWAFMILAAGSPFSGPITGARIVQNIVLQDGRNEVYRFGTGIPASVVIDQNLIWNPGGPMALTTVGTVQDFAALRALGYEQSGLNVDPRLDATTGHSLHLAPDSPAIDGGSAIPGLAEPFSGSAPDIGWWEFPAN